MQKFLFYIASTALFLAVSFSILTAAPKVYKKARIEWDQIEGASEYEVEIRKGGVPVYKKRVQQNYVEAELDHGVYTFRLSVYDHKKVLANRTGWRTLIVKKWGLVKEKYQYAAVGWAYSIMVPEWNTIVRDTNKTFHLYYGYDLPWQGYAVEAIVEYEDFDNLSEDEKITTELSTWTIAPGACVFARMNKYVDVTMHLNVGVGISSLETVNRDEKSSFTSVDPLTIFSLGIRGAYGYGFIEHGVQLKTIYFYGGFLNEVRPFIRAGARF